MTRMAARIGSKISRARERLRWTQQKLADALGVDRKTVDNWENDRTYPRNSIGALEEVLGVTLADDEPDPPPTRESLRDQIARIELRTQEPAIRIIAKDGPLNRDLVEVNRPTYFRQIGAERAQHGDCLVTGAHDVSLDVAGELLARKPGDPNPLIVGKESVQRYMTMAGECAKAGALMAK